MLLLLLACTALDREPPQLEVTPPSTPVATLRLPVVATDASGLTLAVHGVPDAHLDGSALVVPLDALPEGPQTLRIVATDRSVWAHTTVREVPVTVDRTPPTLTVAPVTEGRGRAVAVWVDADEPLVDATVAVLDRTYPLYPHDGRWRALIGVGLRAPLGPQPLQVHARDAAGHEVHHDSTLTVTEVDYPVKGFIRLTKAQREARQDDAAKAQMRAERDGAYALRHDEALWAPGPLALPLDPSRRTSPFGAYRTYSDGERSYHTGMDLTWREGAEILAAAAGDVVIARMQAIHGNAVILSHGQGLFTTYSHLESFAVAEGDRVEAGQALGIMGTTGQSTGPHLHFSVIVGEEAVDPAPWLEGDPAAQ